MRCEDADPLIDEFAEGCLDEVAHRAFADHLDACARCRLAVDSSRRLAAALAALPAAAPSPAADARVLAAVEEERSWARWRVRTRRRVAGLAAATVAGTAAVGAFVALPAASWLDGYFASMTHVAESWLRLRAAPALFEARGTLVAALIVLMAIAAIDRALARGAARRAAG
jgi:hypothetical protein